MTAPIRISQYAKLRGVSAEAVRKAVISKRLSACVVMVNGKPWIGDVILANREWELNTETKHHRKNAPAQLGLGSLKTAPARAATIRLQATPPEGALADPEELESPDTIDPQTGVLKVSVSRARKEYFDAVGAQAKAELLAGSQVNREEVTRAAFNVAREVRDSLFLIKDRLADELATMTEPNKISAYLDLEFRNALAKLAEEIVIDHPDVG